MILASHIFNPLADPDVDTADEITSYVTDAEGLQTSNTNARGTTNFTYDPFDRVSGIESPEGFINYTYDPVTGRKTSTFTGDPADPVNVFTYTYDTFGRLETVSTTKNASCNSRSEQTDSSYFSQ